MNDPRTLATAEEQLHSAAAAIRSVADISGDFAKSPTNPKRRYPMTNLFITVKAFSPRPARRHGPYVHSETPDFDPLLVAYCIDGRNVRLVDLTNGGKLPRNVLKALGNESVIKWTHHNELERISLSRCFGSSNEEYFDPRNWRSLDLFAQMAGLEHTADLGLEWPEHDKSIDDHFCLPCTPKFDNQYRTRNLPCHSPEKWPAFKDQCRREVQAMVSLHEKLASCPVPEVQWIDFFVHQAINDRGMAVDGTFVQQALLLSAKSTMLDDICEELRRFSCSDGRIRGMFQFYGTASIGQGAFRPRMLERQPATMRSELEDIRKLVFSGDTDGLARLCSDVPDAFSKLFCAALIPSPGNRFIVAGFVDIENRIISWLAGESWRLTALAGDKDFYCTVASRMYGVPVEPQGIDRHLRERAVLAEQALCYGGSAENLKAFDTLGTDPIYLVELWRYAVPGITQLWPDVDKAILDAVSWKIETETHGIRFSCNDKCLRIILPSGRPMVFTDLKINGIGSSRVTGKAVGDGTEQELYGPKLAELIVQAIAQDLHSYALKTLRSAAVVAYDENSIVLDAPPIVPLDGVLQQMCQTPPWAMGLPLHAEGYEADCSDV